MARIKSSRKSITPEFLEDDNFLDNLENKVLSPMSWISELENSWLIQFDLPLVNKEDISIHLANKDSIILNAKLREPYYDPKRSEENEFLYFKKTLTLPVSHFEKKLRANFSDGILTISIQKNLSRKKITIE